MRKLKFAGIVFLISIMILSVLGSVVNTEVEAEPGTKSPAKGLTPHEPIYIEGNENFTAENGVVGGSGTESDPYVIEGWDIDGGNSKCGIKLVGRMTQSYFVIRNCHVHDAGGFDGAGIYLYRAYFGKIENVICYNNSKCGICLKGYSVYADTYISNCKLYNNHRDGISIDGTFNTHISNCTIYSNSGDGIDISPRMGDPSNNNRIVNCEIYNNSGNGIHIASGTGDIPPSSNNQIVNCAIYCNDKSGILVSECSSNTQIINCALHHNSKCGINLQGETYYIKGWSWSSGYQEGWTPYYEEVSGCHIANCTINNNGRGIQIDTSINNKLRYNILRNNTYNFGVYGDKISHYYHDIDVTNTINGDPINYVLEQTNLVFNADAPIGYLGLVSCNNITVKNIESYGILLANTSNSIVSNSTFADSIDGIRLTAGSTKNGVVHCTALHNFRGICLHCSPNNELRYNTFKNNTDNFCVDGFSAYGDSILHYYQNIDPTNTVNGKPIYYILEDSSVNFDETSNIGYLGLISSTYIKAESVSCYGLLLVNTSYSTIANSTLRSGYYGIKLRTNSVNNQITNCTIHHNSYGISIWQSSNNTITNCIVSNNSAHGIYTIYSLNNKICYNSIYNNTRYGVYNYNSDSQYIVNATYCWWGSPSGPGGVGPGTGDNITSNVLYDPWLTKPWQEGIEISKPTEKPAEGFNMFYLLGIGVAVAAGIIIAVFLLRRRAAIPKPEIPPKPELIPPQIPTLTIRCPQCKSTFTVEKKEKPFKVKCPSCGKEGVIR